MRLHTISEATHGGVVKITWGDTEDSDLMGQVYSIFDASRIRPDRNKQLGPIALLDDKLVGAVMCSWEHDDDLDADVFSFDVAVQPESRGGGRPHAGLGGSGQSQTVGMQLIDAAIRQYDNEKHDYGDRTMISLYVINPKLARYLERRLGFEVETEYGHGSSQLVRY